MIFNSVEFVVFFLVFFFLYWKVFSPYLLFQNLFLLFSSYFFYAWWDWRFLFLLIASSLSNYLIGILIFEAATDKAKKVFLSIGLVLGLGCLMFFKYFNFFVTSLKSGLALLHIHTNLHTLNIILPLGISFYTFRTLSYLFDINKGKIEPIRDWIVFFSFVSFFPSLISGPIDRATNFVPQLLKKRVFNYYQAVDGLRQILWGLFKKVVIADSCAIFTDQCFEHYHWYYGSTLLLGAFSFAIQVYADFSGYSDMAIGFSRLIGFNIPKNFDFPYFSQNVAEFWGKWHISFTAWLTEYLFTPLTIFFRDYGKVGLILAILINMTACGFWHGANWKFILFGIIQGCYFIPLILSGSIYKKKKKIKGKILPSLREFRNMAATFTLMALTDILFRSDDVKHAFYYIKGIFTFSLVKIPQLETASIVTFLLVLFFMCIEWMGKDQQYGLAKTGTAWKRPFRLSFYMILILVIFIYTGKEQVFMYFKF